MAYCTHCQRVFVYFWKFLLSFYSPAHTHPTLATYTRTHTPVPSIRSFIEAFIHSFTPCHISTPQLFWLWTTNTNTSMRFSYWDANDAQSHHHNVTKYHKFVFVLLVNRYLTFELCESVREQMSKRTSVFVFDSEFSSVNNSIWVKCDGWSSWTWTFRYC